MSHLGLQKLYFVSKIVLTYCEKKKNLVIENIFFRLLELYIQTVKGENNHETKYFLNTLLKVIRYSLEQLKNQLKP